MAVSLDKLEQNIAVLFKAQNKRYQNYRPPQHIQDNKATRLYQLAHRIFDRVTTLPAKKNHLSRPEKLHYFSQQRAKFISFDVQTHLTMLTTTYLDSLVQETESTEASIKDLANQWCQQLAQLNCALFCNERGQLKAQFSDNLSDGIMHDFAQYCTPAFLEQRRLAHSQAQPARSQEAGLQPELYLVATLIGAYNEFIFQGAIDFAQYTLNSKAATLLAEIKTQHAQATAQRLHQLHAAYEVHERAKTLVSGNISQEVEKPAQQASLQFTDNASIASKESELLLASLSHQHASDHRLKFNSARLQAQAKTSVPAESLAWGQKISRAAGIGLGLITAMLTLPVSLPMGIYLNFKQEKSAANSHFAQGFLTGFTGLASPINYICQKLAAVWYVPTPKSGQIAKTATYSALYVDVLQARNGDFTKRQVSPDSPFHAGSYNSPFQSAGPKEKTVRPEAAKPNLDLASRPQPS